MVTFDINLIRARTMPAAQRKAVFWLVALYLLICIVLLAYVANHGTRRIVASSRLGREIRRLEGEFRAVYPGEKDILAFAQRSEERLTQDARRVEIIDEPMDKRVNLSGVLASLKAPLPPTVHLFNLKVDRHVGGARELTFDIVIPAGPMETRVNPGRLVAYWNADEVLMSRTGRIRSVAAQRQNIQNDPVLILRFACGLNGGER